jgi:hypothetical protein
VPPACSARGRLVREVRGVHRGPAVGDHHEPKSSASQLQNVLAHLTGVRCSGDGRWMSRCSHHDDRNASLSIREGDDGKVLLHCFAGCRTVDVVASAGLVIGDLFPPGNRERRRPRVWKGTIPMASHGRPSLESFGDDIVAAMLAELGRLAHVRDRLDKNALRALRTLAVCCGSSQDAVREALAVALASDVT